jgi:uncharacterized membrane protein
MGNIISKVFAVFVALMAFYFVSRFLAIFEMVVAGYIIGFFNISPIGESRVMTLESIGLIINMSLSIYVGLKVYKRITRVKEEV